MCNQVTAHEQFGLQEVKHLQASYKSMVAKYPDAEDVLQQVYKVLGDLVSLAGAHQPASEEAKSGPYSGRRKKTIKPASQKY